jgi:hypothetical protein
VDETVREICGRDGVRSLAKLLLAVAVFHHAMYQPTLAEAVEPDLNALVAKVIYECKVPASYISVVDDKLLVNPALNADYEKVDCMLAHIKKAKVLKIGFIGNAWDPEAVLPTALRYIAVGSNGEIDALMTSAAFEHWRVVKLANSDDGTRFLIFETKAGVTSGQSTILLDRIWKKEFGDVFFGIAPRKLSDNSEDD